MIEIVNDGDDWKALGPYRVKADGTTKAIFADAADAELFLHTKRYVHGIFEKADEEFFRSDDDGNGLEYWIKECGNSVEGYSTKVIRDGSPSSSCESEVLMRLNTDGSVIILNHDAIPVWGAKHGKLFKIILTDVGPSSPVGKTAEEYEREIHDVQPDTIIESK